VTRAQVPETAGTLICSLKGGPCRHFGHAHRVVRREFTILKTRELGSHVVHEELDEFCNAEGMFTASMLHGCANLTGFDYLAARAAEHGSTRTGRTRAPTRPPVPRTSKGSSERYTPARESQQTKLTEVCGSG